METLKCIIIDDEPLATALIEAHLSKIPNVEIVAKCNNAVEAFGFLKSKKVDLMFLDIQMPILTGMEFLKSLSNAPKVILTTAYREYAIESYELDVIDYLLKPISFERFFKAINKCFKIKEQEENREVTYVKRSLDKDFLIINENKKLHKVAYSEILYAESLKDYVHVHTETKHIATKYKISDFEKELPDNFIRTHRSYIVNLDKITAFTTQDVEIDSLEIPIGISFKKQVMQRLKIEP